MSFFVFSDDQASRRLYHQNLTEKPSLGVYFFPGAARNLFQASSGTPLASPVLLDPIISVGLQPILLVHVSSQGESNDILSPLLTKFLRSGHFFLFITTLVQGCPIYRMLAAFVSSKKTTIRSTLMYLVGELESRGYPL